MQSFKYLIQLSTLWRLEAIGGTEMTFGTCDGGSALEWALDMESRDLDGVQNPTCSWSVNLQKSFKGV